MEGYHFLLWLFMIVGMKPLSERDENKEVPYLKVWDEMFVGMKPLSERDENTQSGSQKLSSSLHGRNEATL